MTTAKLFKNGGSQALRIPAQFRFPGDTVQLRQTKQGLLVVPVLSAAEKRRGFIALMGSSPDFPLAAPQPPARIRRRKS